MGEQAPHHKSTASARQLTQLFTDVLVAPLHHKVVTFAVCHYAAEGAFGPAPAKIPGADTVAARTAQGNGRNKLLA